MSFSLFDRENGADSILDLGLLDTPEKAQVCCLKHQRLFPGPLHQVRFSVELSSYHFGLYWVWSCSMWFFGHKKICYICDLILIVLSIFHQQENRKRHGSTRSVVDMELDDPDDGDDNAPLFYQPGKRGFYSPRPGKNTEARLNCFRNIGRYETHVDLSICVRLKHYNISESERALLQYVYSYMNF